MKVGSPDRVRFAPRIAARHRKRAAGGLQAPLRAAHETPRGVRLVEFETMNVLTPQAVRAAEVVLEQTNHGAEGMHHEPPADEPGGIGEAIRKSRRSGIQQQPRRADAICREHDDGRPLEMHVTVAIDVFRARDQSVGIRFEPANACARHELCAALHELRPMRDVHGALGAFDTAPHARGTLLTGLERAGTRASRWRSARATNASRVDCVRAPRAGPSGRGARAAAADPSRAETPDRLPVPTRRSPPRRVRRRARGPRRSAASRPRRRRACARGSPTACCAANAPRK